MKRFEEKNLREILDKQMEINWYRERYDDLCKMNDWYIKFTTTEEKDQQYKDWLKVYLKAFFPKSIIEKQISWHILNYWLKIIW